MDPIQSAQLFSKFLALLICIDALFTELLEDCLGGWEMVQIGLTYLFFAGVTQELGICFKQYFELLVLAWAER